MKSPKVTEHHGSIIAYLRNHYFFLQLIWKQFSKLYALPIQPYSVPGSNTPNLYIQEGQHLCKAPCYGFMALDFQLMYYTCQ